MNLSDWIKIKRLTTIQFAEMLGVSQPTVSRWINGVLFPSKKSMTAIMKTTNGEVSPNDFFISKQQNTDIFGKEER